MTCCIVTYNTSNREKYVNITPGIYWNEKHDNRAFLAICTFIFLFTSSYFFTFNFFFFFIIFSFKGEGLEEENKISNNIVIGLSVTDGLSNIEALSPAGIYIRAPASHIRVRSSGIRHNISFLIKGIRKTQCFIYLGDQIHNICFLAELSEPVLVMGY